MSTISLMANLLVFIYLILRRYQMRKVNDLTGKWFNEYYVIGRAPGLKDNSAAWYCICRCKMHENKTYDQSDVKIKSPRDLKKHKSCGCLHQHGDSKIRFYNIWKGMISRCHNPNDNDYNRYGARGIQVCDHWREYRNFKTDMYDSYITFVNQYGEENTTIERDNVDELYELSNCIWEHINKQQQNTTRQRLFEAAHIKTGIVKIAKCQAQFARDYGLCRSSISQCLSGKYKSTGGWRFKYV